MFSFPAWLSALLPSLAYPQIVWVEEHDKRSFLLDLMDASGLGAKDLDGEASR